MGVPALRGAAEQAREGRIVEMPGPARRGRFVRSFLCECWDVYDDFVDSKEHGHAFADPCTNAVCHHCGWHGTFPTLPKKAAPWEKKALAAGWTPPEARAKELGR